MIGKESRDRPVFEISGASLEKGVELLLAYDPEWDDPRDVVMRILGACTGASWCRTNNAPG
jgi:hypothetical protein